MTTEREMLFLEARARGGVARVTLNDIPVARVGTPTGATTHPPAPREARHVHQLVVPGINRLRVEIDGPSTRALARLVWFTEGDFADSDSAGRLVAEALLPLSEDAGRPEDEVRLVETASLDLGAAFGIPFWSAASPLVLDGDTLDRAEEALRSIASSLEDGDGDRFMKLLGPYLQDALRAYPGLGWADLERIHRDYAKAVGEGGRVHIAPRDRWTPRVVGDGRLIDLRDDEDAPVVTISFPNEATVSYPVMLGWREGELLVVR